MYKALGGISKIEELIEKMRFDINERKRGKMEFNGIMLLEPLLRIVWGIFFILVGSL